MNPARCARRAPPVTSRERDPWLVSQVDASTRSTVQEEVMAAMHMSRRCLGVSPRVTPMTRLQVNPPGCRNPTTPRGAPDEAVRLSHGFSRRIVVWHIQMTSQNRSSDYVL